MAKLSRSPMQVSPEFKKRLDEIQRKIMMARGEKQSLRDITSAIVKSPSFDDIERSIIKAGDMNFDIKVRFDKRLMR